MASKKRTSQEEQDKLERDKRLLMGAGVVFFMTLIGVLWMFNVQQILQGSELVDQKDQKGLNEFTRDLSSTMDDIKKEVKGFKTVATDPESNHAVSPASDQQQQKQEVSSSTIRALKRNLEKKFE